MHFLFSKPRMGFGLTIEGLLIRTFSGMNY